MLKAIRAFLYARIGGLADFVMIGFIPFALFVALFLLVFFSDKNPSDMMIDYRGEIIYIKRQLGDDYIDDTLNHFTYHETYVTDCDGRRYEIVARRG